MTQEEKESIIRRLATERCSCIICKDGITEAYHERGVKDLYRLLTQQPEKLAGTFVADKVVGKGAAALMILGGVQEVYAGVISMPALDLFRKSDTIVRFGQEVPNIINRAGDGICPVEQLCRDCATATECLPLIKEFITKKQTIHNEKEKA